MRCGNCGWENPPNNIKCVKCNVPLEGSMVYSNSDNEKQPTSDAFAKQTARGCPAPNCGYPLIPTDTECPNCGFSFDDKEDNTVQKNANINQPKPVQKMQKPPLNGGTIIQGANVFDDGGDTINKKLVGFLVTYTNSKNGLFFPIYEGRNSIGRDPENDVVIQDKSVSGNHLVVAYYAQNNKFYFETVGLTQNGTYVNNRFFPKGGDELVNNDIINIGDTKLTFIAIPEIAFT